MRRKPKTKMNAARQLDNRLGVTAYRCEFEVVADRVRQLAAIERDELLALCEMGFADSVRVKDDAFRVATCKVTVALLPQSMPLVRRLLALRRTVWDHEVHFSLFCWLDWTQDFPRGWECRGEVLPLVKDYLKKATSNRAHAAWMGVDLLSNHWDSREGLAALVEVIEEGDTDFARCNALSGLEKLRSRRDARKFDAVVRPLLAHLRNKRGNGELGSEAGDLQSMFYGRKGRGLD